MEDRRNTPILKVLLAFLIATLLFLTGFLIGYSVSYLKYQDISQKQETIKNELLSLDLESEFLKSCSPSVFYSISSELDNMGGSLGILEERFGKNDKKVIEQKKGYTLIEVQHFLNVKKYVGECNKNITTIMFFYSNSEPYVDAGERIGYILNSLKSDRKEKVMIYSFDFDLDMAIIKILKDVYNVTSPDTVIVNEKTKLEGISNIDELEKYL